MEEEKRLESTVVEAKAEREQRRDSVIFLRKSMWRLSDQTKTYKLHQSAPRYSKPSKPQQSSMADDTPRSLICLIEGQSEVFAVKASGGMMIMELKDLVKEKGINDNVVLAKDLTLRKVRMSMASDSTTYSHAG
jgi:hypothetical protein